MKIGFIGLGNVGGKLSSSILRNDFDLVVRDLDMAAAQPLIDAGATWGESPKVMAEECDAVITCLPSPAASAAASRPTTACSLDLAPARSGWRCPRPTKPR